MTKNDYFFAYDRELKKQAEERSLKKNRMATIEFFQNHWETSIETISESELAKQAIKELSLKKKVV